MHTRPLASLRSVVQAVSAMGLLALSGCPREVAEPAPDPVRSHEAAPVIGTDTDADPGGSVTPDEPADPRPEAGPESTDSEPGESETGVAEAEAESTGETAATKPPANKKRRSNRSVRYIDCVRSCTKSSPLAELSEAAARSDCEASCAE